MKGVAGRPVAVSTLRVERGARGRLMIVGSVNGQRVRRVTEFVVGQEVQATQLKAEIEAMMLDGQTMGSALSVPAASKTWHDAMVSYVEWKEAEKSIGLDHIAMLTLIDKEIGHMTLMEIDSEFMRGWAIGKSKTWKPGTIRRRATDIKSVMNAAVGRGWLTKLPKFPIPTVRDERDEHFEVAEAKIVIDWVLANVEVEDAVAVVVLMHTGVRLGELQRLSWPDIDLVSAQGSVSVKKLVAVGRKTKTIIRVIPLSDAARDALLLIRPKDAKGLVFVAMERSTRGHRLMRVLRRVSVELGIRRLRVHDLRHTFAFLMASLGADLGDLQLLMGHSNIAMTMRYRGWVQSRAANLMAKL